MAAESYYNNNLPENSKPAAYASPIPLRPINYDYNQLEPQEPITGFSPQISPSPSHEQQGYLGNPTKSRSISKWARYIRIIKLISSLVSTILSALMEACMVYVTIKYYSTRNDSQGGHKTPWARNTKLWPTWMLLVAAGVTLVVTVFSLFALCRAKGTSERKFKIWTTILKYGVHVISWLVVAVLYKLGKTGNDLWGWSCSDKAKAIQSAFKSDLDFQQLCNVQTGSWYLSILEVILKILFAVGHFFLSRKRN